MVQTYRTTDIEGMTADPECASGSAIRRHRREGVFLLLTLAGFIALALITNYPVLRGKVPLAADLITQFPPWAGAGYPKSAPHAEVGDSLTIFYPWRVFQEASLHRRELPLWNPYILAGAPFLAEPQSALFYPIHLLLLAMHPSTFWTFKLLLNFVLSGFFTVVFLRSIGASRNGAMASGLLFSCCGFMSAWQAFSALADAAIWLPFILWAVYRLCSKPSAGRMAVGAFAFAMPVLAGHPETAAHVILMGSAFAVFQCIALGRESRSVGRLMLWFIATGSVAMGLTAVQLLPTLEWIPLTPHSLSLPWPTLSSRYLLAFFSRDLLANPNSAGISIPESAAYIAPLAFLLAPLCFLRRERRHAFFFLIATLVSVFTIYGWWPVQSVVTHIPVLAGLKNTRMLLLADFSIAVLAGLGLTALEEESPENTISRRWVWIAIVIPMMFVTVGIWRLAVSTQSSAPAFRGPGSTAVFLGLGFLVVALRLAKVIHARPFAFSVVAILCADLISFRAGILPFVTRSEIFPKARVLEFLKANADPNRFRVVAVGASYATNMEMVYRLAAINGEDVTLARLKKFLEGFGPPNLDIANIDAKEVATSMDRRLDLLNLKYVIATPYNESQDILAGRPDRFKPVFSDGPVSVFENLNVLPRSFFVPATNNSIEVLPDDEQELRRLKDPSFDPEKSVILPAALPALKAAGLPSSVPFANAHNNVSIISAHTNGLELAAEAAQSGVLVVSQVFYPGWVALVDGKESEVVPADYALVGIPLSAGAHAIQLEFRPSSFRLGLMVSILSLVFLVGLFVVRKL